MPCVVFTGIEILMGGLCYLPLLMENEDLVEVFEIIGHVELAETPLGGTRSKGTVLSSSRRPGRSKPPAVGAMLVH